jgi:hypothetical protein
MIAVLRCQALVTLLTAAPHELGYSAPSLPLAFTASNDQQLFDFTLMASIDRNGRHATHVYQAQMGDGQTVVLKLAPYVDISTEVRPSSSNLRQITHFTAAAMLHAVCHGSASIV